MELGLQLVTLPSHNSTSPSAAGDARTEMHVQEKKKSRTQADREGYVQA